MDRQLLERMVGAGVLVVALIIIAPAILDGRRDNDVAVYSGRETGTNTAMRTHTIRLDRESDSPPVALQLPASQSSGTPAHAAPSAAPKSAPAKSAVAKQLISKQAVKSDPVRVVAVDATPKTAKPSAAAPAGWTVQLGSFSQRQNAERLAREVKARGFDTHIVPVKKSSKTLYRVRVGPRDTRSAASELAAGLAESGYKGQVMSP